MFPDEFWGPINLFGRNRMTPSNTHIQNLFYSPIITISVRTDVNYSISDRFRFTWLCHTEWMSERYLYSLRYFIVVDRAGNGPIQHCVSLNYHHLKRDTIKSHTKYSHRIRDEYARNVPVLRSFFFSFYLFCTRICAAIFSRTHQHGTAHNYRWHRHIFSNKIHSHTIAHYIRKVDTWRTTDEQHNRSKKNYNSPFRFPNKTLHARGM